MINDDIERLNEIVKIIKDSNLIGGISPKKLCDTIEKLGPTYIKIGQIMSTRVDILPVDYCNELSKLRSRVTPLPYEMIENILRDTYSDFDDIFSYVEHTPIGSASIAQVHKAKLKSGDEVVVKIKRPGIDNTIKTDLKLLKKAVNILHLNQFFKVMDLNDVIDQLSETTMEELNFIIEVNHLIEFKNFNISCDYVDCPNVYKDLCTNNVIVMSYIDGISINDIESLKNKEYDLRKIAELLSDNFIKQALTDGFFHADPHPNNILVCDDKIEYIDLGMVGRLSEKNKQALRECIKAIILEDYKEVSRIIVSMSTKLDDVNYLNLENDVSRILKNYSGTNLEKINIIDFISEVFSMLRDNKLVLDKDVTLLIRGIGIIEAVLEDLDPKINLLKVLISSEKYNIENFINKDAIKDVGKKIVKNVNNAIDLPSELSTFLKTVNNQEAKFKIELSDSHKQIDKIEDLVHEIILGFIDGCLIIASVLVNDSVIKSIFIFFIVIVSLWLVIKMIIDAVHKGY